MKIYNITPVPAPRMSKSDVWKVPRRPCVQRYFDFRDKVKELGITISESGTHVTFVLPMPKSWNNVQKTYMDGMCHQSRPDIDNLGKSLMDSLYKEDAHIWDIRITKIWGYEGKIIIK